VNDLWSVSNGFQGYGQVACLVAAANEAEAIAKAVEAFEANNNGNNFRDDDEAKRAWSDPARMYATKVSLPYIGDELP
jgi:hypothetical protein